MKKSMLFLVFAFNLLLGNMATARTLTETINVSVEPINFYFDGKKDSRNSNFFNGKSSIPKGMIFQGTTYVPLRYFSENLNQEVGWDPSSQSVWIGKRPTVFSPASSGATRRMPASLGNSTIQADFVPFSFYFNGQKESESGELGYFYNGTAIVPKGFSYEWSTYVPLRYLSEHLNKEVSWDPTSRTIWVGEKPADLQRSESVSAPGIYGIFIGQPSTEVQNVLGKPTRVDHSPLGYQWWIYNDNLKHYVQVGIQDEKVVDIYSNSPDWSFRNIKVGTQKSEVNQVLSYQPDVSFAYNQANIRITNDQAERPLYLFEDNPVIVYLDKYNQEKVTAIRFIAKEFLLRSKSYALNATYYGQSPIFDPPAFNSEEQTLSEQGSERQILDLTNVIRLRNGLHPLSWNEEAANLGRSHSIDMHTHHFFDHVSATTGLDPFQRMQKVGITFQAAGENIAEGYSDAIEAYEGWMNSIGHRENILNEHFTTLGVGVYEMDYSQEFVTP